MKDTIKKLVEAYGPSGYEEPVRELIRAEIADLADELRVDPLGNLVAVRHPRPAGSAGRRIMLAAHMDEIGVMVSYVDEHGYLRFAPIGGVFPIYVQGSRVRFADGTVGVIGAEQREMERNQTAGLDKLFVDVGATGRADCPVGIGATAGFMRTMEEQGTRLIAKSMDDRIGCAVLIETMRRLKDSPHELAFVFSVQEEVGTRGAQTSAYGLDPEIAIAVDVTLTGDTPRARTMAVSLGQGPAIKVRDSGMLAHPGLKNWMVACAEQSGIPYQLEVLEGGTTDARTMQLARGGVAAGCLSIPCRYVHTPSEMVDTGDVEQAVKLLAALLRAPVIL